MRQKNWIAAILIAVSFFAFSCGNKDKKDKEPEMYKQSELAKLMRDMWAENDRVRTAIINGDSAIVISDLDHGLTTSQPTDSGDLTPTFYTMAGHFSSLVDSFNLSADTQHQVRYNAVINGCVTCHESFCTGPLTKIKKLYLPK